VEAVLAQHHQIKQVVVVQEADVTDRLIAYIVPEPQASPTTNELRRWLLSKLPDYMVPSAFVIVDTFPLTPSGKIDRQAITQQRSDRLTLDHSFVAPRNAVEHVLASLWKDVLGVDQIGVEDNFFNDLGGHSLLATQLITRTRDTFHIKIPLQLIFEHPTIEAFAEAIQSDPKQQHTIIRTAELMLELENMSEEEVESILTSQ
jgi:acyl carrier protein